MTVELILLTFLLFCAVAVCLTKNLLSSVIIFMSYSAVTSVLWIFLRAPDLAITEAAVGVGLTSTLFFVTLSNIQKLKDEGEETEDGEGF
ncbi:MAG: hydrogenase subunit MbhD domain-containing protein [Eubacteriales bacterium]